MPPNQRKTQSSGALPRVLSHPIRAFGRALEAYIGTPERRRKHQIDLDTVPSIEQGIQNLERRFGKAPDVPADAPVFILSSGWRTGSTLLQRLVMSSNEVLVWGEPYAHCGHIRRLAESLRAFTAEFPLERDLLRNHLQQGLDANTWLANLCPDPECLLQAHRRFFQALFAEPAMAVNYPSWGVKATRLDQGHAVYLKWLFPRGRFLYVFRNPYDAYRSYRRFRKQVWYESWPDRPMLTPARFGAHWQKLLRGFLDGCERLNGRLVKYEDLCAGRLSIDSLAEYLQLNLRRDVLSVRISSGRSATGRDPANPHVTQAELRLLRKAVEPLASELGYAPVRATGAKRRS